jgi:hypothetical protein
MGNLLRLSVLGLCLIATPASASFLYPTDGLDPAGREVFDVAESVFAIGQVSAGSIFPVAPAIGLIYIVPNRVWSPGDGLSGDVTPGGALNVAGKADIATGTFIDILIWSAPLIPGEYDIVIDDDLNGIYDGGVFDFVYGSGAAAGLVVTPLPSSIVLFAFAMVGLKGVGRRRR